MGLCTGPLAVGKLLWYIQSALSPAGSTVLKLVLIWSNSGDVDKSKPTNRRIRDQESFRSQIRLKLARYYSFVLSEILPRLFLCEEES